jgi:hypothetical protein
VFDETGVSGGGWSLGFLPQPANPIVAAISRTKIVLRMFLTLQVSRRAGGSAF